MREIKFRAWDVDKMIYEPIVYTAATQVSLNSYFAVKNPSYVLMQFTGLKDKNGKEIYEGDIVKGNWPTNNIVVVECKDLATGACPYNDDYFFDGKDTEVIGNIHENPEILTQRSQ